MSIAEQVLIRKMTEQDIAQVHHIEQQVQTHPWSLKQFHDAVQSYQCTVLQYQSQVIGFCIFQTVLDEASLLLIGMDPQFQGQGLGTYLLEQSIAQLNNNPIQIFLEVRQSNVSAIRLYEKLAFHQIDLRHNYYPCIDGGKEHAVIMVKSQAENFADLFKT